MVFDCLCDDWRHRELVQDKMKQIRVPSRRPKLTKEVTPLSFFFVFPRRNETSCKIKLNTACVFYLATADGKESGPKGAIPAL